MPLGHFQTGGYGFVLHLFFVVRRPG